MSDLPDSYSKDLEFWFDFGSPYSFLSAMRLASASHLQIHWRPFLLTEVFNTIGWHGALTQASIAKRSYVWRDIERSCTFHGFRFQKPSVYPRIGKSATAIAIYANQEKWQPLFCQEIFRLSFQLDTNIDSPEVVRSLLNRLGVNDRALVGIVDNKSVQEALNHRATEEAITKGLFGSPSFTKGTEIYWGNSRLPDFLNAAQSKTRANPPSLSGAAKGLRTVVGGLASRSSET